MQLFAINVCLVLSGLIHGGAVELGQPELIRPQPLTVPLTMPLLQPPAACQRRLYTYRVVQMDGATGGQCQDRVSVWACVGECVSQQVADWRFPYRDSYHPVCVHSQRSKAVAVLRDCDAGVADETRRYEYVEAEQCQCQICSSSDTVCEAPRPAPRVGDSVQMIAMDGTLE